MLLPVRRGTGPAIDDFLLGLHEQKYRLLRSRSGRILAFRLPLPAAVQTGGSTSPHRPILGGLRFRVVKAWVRSSIFVGRLVFLLIRTVNALVLLPFVNFDGMLAYELAIQPRIASRDRLK